MHEIGSRDQLLNYVREFVALKISFKLLKASLMALIHSIIPALFEKGASNKIITLYKYLQDKKRVKNED